MSWAGGHSICSAAIATGRSPASIIKGYSGCLTGDRIIELQRDKAIIKTKTGARQTYRRRPAEVGRVVLAWEALASDY
jgi:hypothetical protein